MWSNLSHCCVIYRLSLWVKVLQVANLVINLILTLRMLWCEVSQSAPLPNLSSHNSTVPAILTHSGLSLSYVYITPTAITQKSQNVYQNFKMLKKTLGPKGANGTQYYLVEFK